MTLTDLIEDYLGVESAAWTDVDLNVKGINHFTWVDEAYCKGVDLWPLLGHLAPEGDFAADTMNWEILVKCGGPSVADVGATFSPATSEDGWFGMPDNCAVDAAGRLWIATDGNSLEDTGRADGRLEFRNRHRDVNLPKECPAGHAHVSTGHRSAMDFATRRRACVPFARRRILLPV